jgi:hypothetical protein
LIKSAGEHWVASVLSGLSWAAALTRDGLERTDVLAVHATKRIMVEIQVTAASHPAQPNWRTNRKAQRPSVSRREWFVLVALAPPIHGPHTERSSFRGITSPRQHGFDIRIGSPSPEYQLASATRAWTRPASRIWVVAGYENRWDLLEVSSDVVPVLLPADFRALAKSTRVGLPLEHPWNANLPAW